LIKLPVAVAPTTELTATGHLAITDHSDGSLSVVSKLGAD